MQLKPSLSLIVSFLMMLHMLVLWEVKVITMAYSPRLYGQFTESM
uniref:Uncharacterized protein n=1 Tax=Rhizophora mucronata TaxID=61149 RepID=A0A2P2IT51_RHIMU